MNSAKEIEIKNGTYYFFDDMINIKNLYPKKIKARWKYIKEYSYLAHPIRDGQRP